MADSSSPIDDFLEHETRATGGRGAYLSWRKTGDNKAPVHVDVFLHTRCKVEPIWSFPWPRVQERKSKDPGGRSTLEVWSGSWNSWEDPEVLKRQWFFDRSTGELDAPPQLCPLARLVAAVRVAVFSGQLDWVEPLFEFRGDDPRRAVVLHAGGMCGMYKGDKLDAEQKEQLKQAKIYLKDAWKESMMARCQYLFQVCDAGAPAKGLQIAIESAALGDSVKGVIRDAMAEGSLGPDKGNPLKHPYAFRWHYDPNETPNKRYRAARMDGIPVTAEVEAAIVVGPPRDVEREISLGNVVELRTSVDEHYCGPAGVFDWDEIFAPAMAELDGQLPPGAAAEREARSAAAARVADDVVGDLGGDDERPEEAPTPAEEMFGCDACEAPMRASETTCAQCGWVVPGEEPAPAPEPEKPKPRSRSEAGKPAAAAQPAATKPAAAKPAAAQQAAAARQSPKPFAPAKSEPVRAPAGRRVKG